MPETIEKWFLAHAEKGMRFDQQPIQTPFFQTYPQWPQAVMERLPIGFQCVEVHISDKKFQIKRQLVIDVEVLETTIVNTSPVS